MVASFITEIPKQTGMQPQKGPAFIAVMYNIVSVETIIYKLHHSNVL